LANIVPGSLTSTSISSAQIATLADRLAKLYPRAEIEVQVQHLTKVLDERIDNGAQRPKPPRARGMPTAPHAIPQNAVVDDGEDPQPPERRLCEATVSNPGNAAASQRHADPWPLSAF
jgi:hypothetical protein